MTNPNPSDHKENIIVDYQNPMETDPEIPAKPKSPGKFVAKFLITVFLGLSGLIALYAHIIITPQNEREHRIRCASNLRQIGQAIELYIANHKAPPDTLFSLITASNLGTDVWICPSSDDTAAGNSAGVLNPPGHCSYVYYASGRSLQWFNNPDHIVASENSGNHDHQGNILFADGHVEWFPNIQYVIGTKP
jgi:prepilin-type processing-associated H-X9-DG protein